jgi:hypothetical protein
MSEATNYMSLSSKDIAYHRVSTFFGPLCVCLCVCVCVYIYIYTYVYIHTHIQRHYYTPLIRIPKKVYIFQKNSYRLSEDNSAFSYSLRK